MRIVHVLTRLLRAGSEENTLLTAAGQIALGHEVILVHGHEVMADNAYRRAPGIRLIEVPDLTRELRPRRDVAAYRDMRDWFAALQPDVVHTHQSKAGIVGRFAASAAGVPLIVHGVHILPFLGVNPVRRAVYLALERRAAGITHGYIHVSEGMRRACLENGVGTRQRHHVVASGFDLSRFASALPPAEWRELLGVGPTAPKPPVVAMLAALEPRKRHLELLRHVAPMLRARPEVRLVFAGEGALAGEVAAAAVALGVETQVRMLGYRDDPERIIAMADVCVHCSEREGLPRSVLQYLAAGRPVVMFHLPGIEDVVADGGNGHLVAQEDWPGFLARLGDLLDHVPARAAMSGRARRTDLGAWDGTLMATRTLSFYEALAGAASPGVAA